MKIRTLIVDDEPLARRKIRNLLKGETDVQIIGESADGQEAVADMMKKKPDLVFLDIQMPEMDGFEVIETVELKDMPAIIFVTAYDEYALRAFEVHAVDYLLKPIDEDRFREALQRVRQELKSDERPGVDEGIRSLIKELKKKENYLKRLLVKRGDRIHLIRVDDIIRIEAASYYVRLHVVEEDEKYLMRITMKKLEKRLDPRKFLRIHRSTIVNIDCIKEIQSWFNKEYMIILNNNEKLVVSRSYKDKVFNRLKQ
jgi:two-component system LytT family response regulator